MVLISILFTISLVMTVTFYNKYITTKKSLLKVKRELHYFKIKNEELDKKVRDVNNQNIILESLLRKDRVKQ